MILDATTRKIQAFLSGAAATTNPTVTTDWVDFTATTTTAGSTPNNLNGATAVDIVAAPAASTIRKVNGLNIYNADTAPVTVTVRYNDNATLYILIKVVLAVGQTLTYTDTDGWLVTPVASTVVPGTLIKRTVLTAGTSFTTQPNTTKALVRILAAGGAGGGGATVASQAAAGSGGGGGGYAEKEWAVVGNTAYAYTIGVGGTVGAAGANPGNAGGNSTFVGPGPVTVTALGGAGGIGMAAGTTVLAANGGSGGLISTNGDLNGAGYPGENSTRSSGLLACSGSGGSSKFGGGGASRITQGNGLIGTAFGAGGSGGCVLNGGAATTGGAGTNGLIIVEEYA